MAEILISPGHLSTENDNTHIKSLPTQLGAAILGPTVKGKKDIPVLVTSYSEYVANFGSTFESGSDTYSFLTSISAYNYFQNGGKSLLVTKIGSGSFSPALSTDINSNAGLKSGIWASPTILQQPNLPGQSSTTINNVVANGNANGTGAVLDIELVDANSWVIDTITVVNEGVNFVPGEILTVTYSDLGALTPGNDLQIELQIADLQSVGKVFELETLSEGTLMNSDSNESSKGALEDGTVDNLRWEISHSDPINGTFTLLIRRGNDNTKSKSVLESFTNLSLDPKASNYISRIIGDRTVNKRGSGTDIYIQSSGSFRNASNFVRVKEVHMKTPDFFDNDGTAKPQYTSSIPTVQRGAFDGAVGDVVGVNSHYYNEIDDNNTQGVGGNDYIDAINLLANKDDFQYNMVTTPGLIYSNSSHRTAINTLISIIESRGDAIVVVDLENYDSTITAVTTTAKGIDSSYVASYWPWVEIADPDTGQLVYIPASTIIPGVYSFNDISSEVWFAPAGMNRGGMSIVTDAERKLTVGNRDDLYVGKVNPLATYPGKGVVVFGNKTLQSKPSATDRINVRRLIIEAKSYIGQIADTLVFDPNSAVTRNLFTSQVNPFLESIQQRQGLYAFKVIMDDTNNTGDVIDRNQLIGQIYLQPTRTAEFIYLDFNITPTGATFPD